MRIIVKRRLKRLDSIDLFLHGASVMAKSANNLALNALEQLHPRNLKHAAVHLQRLNQHAAVAALGPEHRERIAALANDFPGIWCAPTTADRDKKRMLRLLIEDVTVFKDKEAIAVHVRFRGGATRSISLPRPLPAWKSWLTPDETVSEIDRLLEQHTDAEIADILNRRGFRSGQGHRFHGNIVYCIRRKHGLKSRYQRLRDLGLVTADELAKTIGVSPQTILRWRKNGILKGHAYTDKGQCLYDPEASVPDGTARWPRPTIDPKLIVSTGDKEVQYEA